jgi:regulator of protease activity HflC (stomatin/prohibitin superfamily)
MWDWIAKAATSLRMIVLVLPGQRGVICRRGQVKEVREPSLSFVIPIIDDATVVCVAEQVEDLRTQSVTTADGKAIMVSGKIRYRVEDPVKALFDVYDWDAALADEALGVIATECMKRSFKECLNHLDLANEILKAVRRVAKKWGIEVTGFTFTDMVVHRALRLEWNKSLMSMDD